MQGLVRRNNLPGGELQAAISIFRWEKHMLINGLTTLQHASLYVVVAVLRCDVWIAVERRQRDACIGAK